MEITELQKEFDTLNENLSEAKSALEKFETKVSKSGMFINKGKIQEDKKEWTAFWDIDYYSHTSDPIYKYFKGAEVINKDSIEFINEFISKWKDATKQEKIDMLSEFDFPYQTPYPITNEFEMFMDCEDREMIFFDNKITNKYGKGFDVIVTEDKIRFEIINSREVDQNECAQGSFVEFITAGKAEIAKNLIKEKESRG